MAVTQHLLLVNSVVSFIVKSICVTCTKDGSNHLVLDLSEWKREGGGKKIGHRRRVQTLL